MDEGGFGRALKMQALAILLTSNIPPVVKKKALFSLLNEAEIRFSKEELESIEEMFKPVDIIACERCHAPQPKYHAFCFNCGVQLYPIASSAPAKQP